MRERGRERKEESPIFSRKSDPIVGRLIIEILSVQINSFTFFSTIKFRTNSNHFPFVVPSERVPSFPMRQFQAILQLRRSIVEATETVCTGRERCLLRNKCKKWYQRYLKPEILIWNFDSTISWRKLIKLNSSVDENPKNWRKIWESQALPIQLKTIE